MIVFANEENCILYAKEFHEIKVLQKWAIENVIVKPRPNPQTPKAQPQPSQI